MYKGKIDKLINEINKIARLKRISYKLENRLNNEFPNVYRCILISGDWKIGKTYFF